MSSGRGTSIQAPYVQGYFATKELDTNYGQPPPPATFTPPRKKEKKKKRGYDRKEEGQKPVAGELKECCCEWVYIYGLHIYRMYVK